MFKIINAVFFITFNFLFVNLAIAQTKIEDYCITDVNIQDSVDENQYKFNSAISGNTIYGVILEQPVKSWDIVFGQGGGGAGVDTILNLSFKRGLISQSAITDNEDEKCIDEVLLVQRTGNEYARAASPVSKTAKPWLYRGFWSTINRRTRQASNVDRAGNLIPGTMPTGINSSEGRPTVSLFIRKVSEGSSAGPASSRVLTNMSSADRACSDSENNGACIGYWTDQGQNLISLNALYVPYISPQKNGVIISVAGRWKHIADCSNCDMSNTQTTGVTAGRVIGRETEAGRALSVMIGLERTTSAEVGSEGAKASTSYTQKVEITGTLTETVRNSIQESFERSASQEAGVSCDRGRLFFWETIVTRDCSNSSPDFCAVETRSQMKPKHVCTSTDDVPPGNNFSWSGCEQMALEAETQNVRSPYSNPVIGYKCRPPGLLIKEATYGENCSATAYKTNNVRQSVMNTCSGELSCTINPASFGVAAPKNGTCDMLTDVKYTCPGTDGVELSKQSSGEFKLSCLTSGVNLCSSTGLRNVEAYPKSFFSNRMIISSVGNKFTCNLVETKSPFDDNPIHRGAMSVYAYTEDALTTNPDLWILPQFERNNQWVRPSPGSNFTVRCEGSGCGVWPRGDYMICKPSKGDCKGTISYRLDNGKTQTVMLKVGAPYYGFEITEMRLE